MEELRHFVFFENWRDMAEGRDTDEKRLAFYDAIMQYAFDGVVPSKPVKGVSHGRDWAAWDAYNAVKPVLTIRNIKAAAGRAGGLAGRGESKARFGNANAIKPETQAETQAQSQAGTQAETQAINKIKQNKIKEKDISGGKPPPSLSAKEVKERFEKFWTIYPSSCPRKYDKRKCLAKWELIFRSAKDADALFAAVMDGLAKWKRSAMWNESDGRYIKAPLVWLNGSCWEDAPREEAANASAEDREAMMERIAEPIVADLKRKGLM